MAAMQIAVRARREAEDAPRWLLAVRFMLSVQARAFPAGAGIVERCGGGQAPEWLRFAARSAV